MDITYVLGQAVGLLATPAIALATLLRRARLFHPTGGHFAARVEPADHPLGRRLGPRALVRVSSAAYKGLSDRQRDLLGLTIRFGDDPGPQPTPGDQDLLMLNAPRLGAAASSLPKSNTRDALDNTFFSIASSRDAELGRVVFRARSTADSRAEGDDALDRLAHGAARGAAAWELEVRKVGTGTWEPVARVVLEERLPIGDQESRFSPFHAGKGLVPDGFLGGLRSVAYPVGRFVRRG